MLYSTPLSTALTAAPARNRVHRSRPWRALFGIPLLAALVSCNDRGYDHGFCYDCGVMPNEVSLGVVTGNFNSSGFASVVALSSI